MSSALASLHRPPLAIHRRTFSSVSILLLLLILSTLFLASLSQSLPTDSDDTDSPPPIISDPALTTDSNDSQQPLRPHSSLPASNTTTTQRVGSMGRPSDELAEAEQTDSISAEMVSDESGFWVFEFVVLTALVPSVWYWRKRKQHVTAMHHRRLDRMVNS